MILIDLIYNLTLLVALSVVSGFVDTRWTRHTRLGALLQGVVFGGAAVIAMLRPLVLAPGLIFDGRSVMISLGAFFFGPWTASAACLMTIPLRVFQGGPGAVMGVLVILASAAIGLGFRRRRQPKSREVSASTLMEFGVAVHLAMLAMTLALPREMIIPVIKRIGLPVMLAYPLATVLIGKILSDQAARGHFLESLQESERRFRAIFNSTFQLAGLMTPDGILTEVNQAALDFAGVKHQDVLQCPFWETPWWRGNEARVQQLRAAITRAAHGEFVRYEVELQGGGQTTAIIDFSLKPIFNPVGQVTLLLPEGRDITERKRVELALRETEYFLTRSQAVARLGSYKLEIATNTWICTPALDEIFGINDRFPKTAEGWLRLIVPEQRQEMRQHLLQHVITEHHRFEREYRIIRHNDGQERWVFGLGELEFDAHGQPALMIGTIQDITERKQAEEALRASLDEKVALLNEVHHRVKNNLQIISSLLNLQARKIPSPEVQAFVRDTQNRIHAMALLHEALYGSGNLARVSFPHYVNSVCAHVARAYSSDSLNLRMLPDIADVSLPLDQAIPAGLIINELVSNALKHAFAGRTDGEITVQLRVADDHHYVLAVVDNGVGLPATTHPRTAGTLGLRLVESLVQQLEGQMTVERDAGTGFQIVFPRQLS